MKVLFDHPSPFLMAHGGFQIQIERTKSALRASGVEVEYLRWWDERQTGDLIHYFSPASAAYLQQAEAIHLPVVMTTLFTETCNRSDFALAMQGCITRAVLASPFGKGAIDQLKWRTFARCRNNVVGLQAEKKVLQTVYGVSSEAISVIPLGLSEIYLNAGNGTRSEDHLICTGTITRRKNPLLLAELAKEAETPILFVGKPYHESDPYWCEFKAMIDQRWVKYHPHVAGEKEMVQLLKSARGYVLLSEHENWCLSAHEAAACGLPLLVPNQKWSKERFGEEVFYFNATSHAERVATLRKFYQDAPSLKAPAIKFYSWEEVARRLKSLYESILSTSR